MATNFVSLLTDFRVWILIVVSSILTTNYSFFKLQFYNNFLTPNVTEDAFRGNLTSSIAKEINRKLHAHTSDFSPAQVVEVVPGIYSAVGFGLANSILIEGNTGCILVDTMESNETAQKVKDAYAKIIKKKPIHTIIFSHFHADHTQGTGVFIEPDKPLPTLIGHDSFVKEYTGFYIKASQAINWRSIRQFASELQSLNKSNTLLKSNIDLTDIFINNGIGPTLDHLPTTKKSIIFPTKTFKGEYTDLDIDGIKGKIHHAPGETNDQIFIHIINYKNKYNLLLPADNIYKAFPNLYAIRGSTPRPIDEWIASLDKMRNLKPFPKYMVPSHTLPVEGEKEIYNLLTIYRDGISYIHDQTIRYMNRGYYLDDIVPIIYNTMPKRLKDHPYLQEYYGTIEWSARAVFTNYLGWFSGDPAHLFPLTNKEKGHYLIKLMDYIRQNNDNRNSLDLMIAYLTNEINIIPTKVDLKREDCQQILEFSSYLYNYVAGANTGIDKQVTGEEYIQSNDKNINTLKNIKIQAMKCMSQFTVSANGRNYYLSSIFEAISGKRKLYSNLKSTAVDVSEAESIFYMGAMRYKAEENWDYNETYSIVTHDDHTITSYVLRDGVVELKRYQYNKKYDLSNLNDLSKYDEKLQEWINDSQLIMYCDTHTWKKMALADAVGKVKIFTMGDIKLIKGGVLDLKKFGSFFEND